MFYFRTHQELTCVAEGSGEFYTKMGAMIAYQGKFKAEKVMLGPSQGQGLFRSVVNLASRKLTGENMPLMKVKGDGVYYMADQARHICVISLQPNQSIGVESENLLAFTDGCKYGVRFIATGVASQKGLFTSELKGVGQNPQVAVIADGNPLILETPCSVDPDAVVCWTGPDPSFKIDVGWKTFIGQASGESYYFEFNQPGETVIVQPFERESGIDVGID